MRPSRKRWAAALVAAALAALCSTAIAAGAAKPPPGANGPGPALDAANRINGENWHPLGRQSEEVSQDWLERTFEGKLASGKGKVGPAKWRFSLKVDDVDSRVDLSRPPGFRRLASSGFTIGFPQTGTWRLGAAATLKGRAKVKVGGTTIFSWSPKLRLSLSLPRFKLSLSGSLGPNAEDPRLVGGGLLPEASAKGGGVLPSSTIPVRPEQGSGNPNPGLAGSIDVPLDLPGLSARLKARLRVVIEPAAPLNELGIEVPDVWKAKGGHLRNALNAPFSEVRVTLDGKLTVRLERVGKRKLPFKLTFGIPIVTSPEINYLLMGIRALSGLQPRFGVAGPPTPPPAPSLDAALPQAAKELEQAILPHLPEGLVHSLDIRSGGAPHPRPRAGSSQTGALPPTFAVEADSAIWTGHYLAAEAFRYAATNDPAALARVRTVMGGIRRLFEVTQDAVVYKGKIRPVPGAYLPNKIFARTALPDPLEQRFEKALSKRKCHYVNPDGGWRLSFGASRGPRRAQKTESFATYREAQQRLEQLPAATRLRAKVDPVGPVWYGFGCGDDHNLSRDQYAGIFYGLTFAHQLVADQEVKDTAARLIDGSLDFLIGNDYRITLPHGKDTQNYWFSWDKQIAMLRIGAEMRPERYRDRYLKAAAALPLAWIPPFFAGIDPLHQYYKFNLAQATFLPALFLEGNEALRPGFEFAHDVMTLPLRHHKNAYFTLAEILSERGPNRGPTAESPAGSNPSITKAQEVKALLGQWLARRDAVRGPNNLPYGRVPDPDFLSRLWPADVSLYRKLDFSNSCVARYPLPVDKRIGRSMDFIWQRQPFEVGIKAENCSSRSGRTSPSQIVAKGAPAPNREGPGVDFLLPYWMGVYLGVLPK